MSLDIQSSDPAWYQLLVSQLTEEDKKEIEEVFRLADQKRAAAGQSCHLIVIHNNLRKMTFCINSSKVTVTTTEYYQLGYSYLE